MKRSAACPRVGDAGSASIAPVASAGLGLESPRITLGLENREKPHVGSGKADIRNRWRSARRTRGNRRGVRRT